VEAIFAPHDADWSAVCELRSQGKRVISGLSNNDTPAASGCTSSLVCENNQWIVKAL